MKMTQHWCMIREIAVDSRCGSYNLVGLACDDWGGGDGGRILFGGTTLLLEGVLQGCPVRQNLAKDRAYSFS